MNNLVISAITRRSRRDDQRSLGPSDLGERCDLCLGEKILLFQKGARQLSVRRRFSYAAWVGTAIHEKMDRQMALLEAEVFTERELTLEIGDIPGLGTIWGHCDCFVPEWAGVADYKTKLDKEAVRKVLHQEEQFQTLGEISPLLEKMWDQTMLYGLGAERSGRPVEEVSLVVLPRYSDSLDEIKTITRGYDRDRALGVLSRVARVAEGVRLSGLSGVETGSGCYTCKYLRM